MSRIIIFYKKTLGFLTVATCSCLILSSCEDIISPTLESAAPVYVVDAWINNKPEVQTIILTRTQPYFENEIPPGVSGAGVSIVDDKGKTYIFTEDDKRPGYYQWTPAPAEVFGTVGNKYTLTITVSGETFTSSSYMGRVPAIDSITFRRDRRRNNTSDSLTRAEFWATDPKGTGDAYFIRSYKNGVLLNKPGEINIAYDAGFSAGGEADGVTFIAGIRRRINTQDEDANGNIIDPIVSGDSVNVQINSITPSAFDYLNEVSIQTNRPGGFGQLFATPLANVSTNISNLNETGTPVLGFFNVAAVTTAGKRYTK